MPRSRFRLTSLVLLSSAFVILPVIDKPLHAQSSSSALMDAMSAELSRATSSLGKDAKDGQQPPYYLSYSAHDVFTVALTAQQGALLNDDSGHQRVVDVVVRVGDPKLDNTHGTHRTSAITTIPLPLEDDSKAIRRSLWWATNTGYGNALQSYLQVKTETEVRAKEEDTSPDFSKDPASSAAGQPVAAPQVDKQEWGQRLRALSNIFRGYPHVYSNFVMLNVQDETGYFVSSEGAKIVDPHRSARLVVFASTRAADGMDLFRAETFEAETISGLPAQKEMEAAIHRLGARLEGQRQRGDQEGQTFTKDIGKPILPSFLSVADDPTMTTFEGTSLSGYYSYDDEGQRAQKVNLIQDGVLKTFLMSRLPIASFANSNGHGRAQIGLMPTGRQGNLIVTSTKTVPEKTLRKMLIDEAKKQNKPYGLYFEDISSGFAVTTRNAPQAFQVIPLVVYRVYTDGRPDELVRGVSIVGTPQAALNRILATGDKREVFNGECGAESGTIPVSAIAPAMLVSEIETQRQQQGISRPPILPPPTAKTSGEVKK
jgi:TldD protein